MRISQEPTHDSVLDAVVIGGGHAGLSASYYLNQAGLKHLVFERGRIGESWRSQRWDSFAMNTANKKNVLPGQAYSGSNPDGFCSANDFVTMLEAYASSSRLPIKEHARVTAVEKTDDESMFTISVSADGSTQRYRSKQLIVASGSHSEAQIPAFARNIPEDITQMHASTYRRPSLLPEGAVLVIGSAQSGCQVAEDLAEAGRKVYLSTSMVARVPRRYRGKDIVDWLTMTGFFNLKTSEVTDPKVFAMKVPLLSGVGELGHTLSYQALARKGVVILGKMEGAHGHHISFSPNAKEHVKFADGFSQKVKMVVDEFIQKSQTPAPPPEEDAADVPDTEASCASDVSTLDMKAKDITSIIWTTGFRGDFSYLKLPVLDDQGNPIHTNGLSDHEGLYFLGLPWLRVRKSAMIFGITEDGESIVEAVRRHAAQTEGVR